MVDTYKEFIETFEDELELWENDNFKDIDYEVDEMFHDERNYNNADKTSGQTCWLESDIEDYLKRYCKEKQKGE